MAIGITGVYADSASTARGGQTNYVTGSFTPSNNSLLVVHFYLFANETTNYLDTSFSASGGGLGWTRQLNKFNPATSNPCVGTFIFTAPVTTGASMTVTISGLNNNISSQYVAIQAYCITGYDTSTPIGATGTGGITASGAQSITLSGAPASTSCVVGSQNFDPAGSGAAITQGTGWTHLYDLIDGLICADVQYNIGTTSTTVPWQSITGTDSVFNSFACQVAIEFRAAAGGGETITVDKWYSEAGLIRPVHYRKNSLVAY